MTSASRTLREGIAVVQRGAPGALLGIGVVVTWLAAQADRRPGMAHLAGATIVAGFFVTIVGVGLLSAPIRPVLPWWSIVVANAMAVGLAGWYLLRRHPGIWRRRLPFGD